MSDRSVFFAEGALVFACPDFARIDFIGTGPLKRGNQPPEEQALATCYLSIRHLEALNEAIADQLHRVRSEGQEAEP
ncbi:MAG: hypothetical protein H3C58_08010 [Fimbriimonadaceae bacterium]|nr:hypothetical protein [Fimbriimonadaceae bacterium]